MYHDMEAAHGVTSQRLASTTPPQATASRVVRLSRQVAKVHYSPRPSARAAFSLVGPIDQPPAASTKMSGMNSFGMLGAAREPPVTRANRTEKWASSLRAATSFSQLQHLHEEIHIDV